MSITPEQRDEILRLARIYAAAHPIGVQKRALSDLRTRLNPLVAEPAEQAPTRESERAELVAAIGDCCGGGDPLCAGGCLASRAAIKRAEHHALAPYGTLVSTADMLAEERAADEARLHAEDARAAMGARLAWMLHANGWVNTDDRAQVMRDSCLDADAMAAERKRRQG